MQIAEAFVAIRPDVNKAQFQAAITQGIQGPATAAGQTAGKAVGTGLSTNVTQGATQAGQKAGQALSQGMTSTVRNTVRDLGAIVGTIGAGVFLKGAFTVEESAITSQAKLLAILKSTGGEAGVTAESVDKLSASISKSAAVADEEVKNAAALLLSFRDVRNEAGKGNDVFDRTLKVATDLSAAFGRDLQSSVTQLGRALENPAAGLTALTRSGITFSQQTRDQIKVLTEQGNLLGAQTVILDEVEKKFGGTAAAIAQADPFKRFSADLVVFKEQVGADLLPIADEILHVAESLFSVFEKLPDPIRSTAEAVVVLGIAGAGLARVATVLGAVTGLSGGLAAIKASLFGVAAGEEAAAAAGVGLGGIIGGLAVGLGAGALAGQKINQVLAGNQPATEAYAKSLGELGKRGALSGTALDALGEHATKLSGDLKTIEGSTFEKAFGFAPSAHRAVADIKSVNDALISLLDTQGKEAATKAFAKIFDDLVANGTKVGNIGPQFHPFLDALDKVDTKAGTAAKGVEDLATKIQNLLGANSPTADLSGKLGVEDQIQAAKDAVDALNVAKLEAAGVGEKSTAAAQAEADANRSLADAYHSVEDAQRGVRDASERLAQSQQSLADAQKNLAEFDNPAAATIRGLERTQITNRAIVSPSDVRQKQIDLFNFDQANADKQASLQKSVADGVRGVRDAHEAVSNAVQHESDAVAKVADSQRKVQAATLARKKVTEDALLSIAGLERKAEEAALNAGTAFAAWADQAKPADDVLKSMLKTLQAIALTAGDPKLAASIAAIVASIQPPAGPGQLGAGNVQHGGFGHGRTGSGPAGSLSALNPFLLEQVTSGNAPITTTQLDEILKGNTDAAFLSSPSKTQVEFLHKLGVPGFALGGIVPGFAGQPQIVIAHGGERVQTPAQQAQERPPEPQPVHIEQHNHYHDTTPKPQDVEWANIQLGFLIGRRGGRA